MTSLSVFRAATLSAAVVFGAIRAQASGPPTTFKCSAAQIKCANGKATAILGCHGKSESTGAAVDPACLAKAARKFTFPRPPSMATAEQAPLTGPLTPH